MYTHILAYYIFEKKSLYDIFQRCVSKKDIGFHTSLHIEDKKFLNKKKRNWEQWTWQKLHKLLSYFI